MTMQREIPVTSLTTVDIHQEHRIAAPPDSVFTILTDRIGEWWTHPYRLHDGESTIRVDRAPGGMAPSTGAMISRVGEPSRGSRTTPCWSFPANAGCAARSAGSSASR